MFAGFLLLFVIVVCITNYCNNKKVVDGAATRKSKQKTNRLVGYVMKANLRDRAGV